MFPRRQQRINSGSLNMNDESHSNESTVTGQGSDKEVAQSQSRGNFFLSVLFGLMCCSSDASSQKFEIENDLKI
jgi:hypothetical protein